MNRNSYYLNSITSFQVHFRGETLYHYDPLNQLQKVQYPGYTEELFYDKAGNRTKRIAQGVEELYQYDPRNRLTAYTKNGATTLFRYDHAGNLLSDDKARYSYDAFNRTTQVETFDGNIQLNRYDAEGLRHEMEENGSLVKFIFNPDREVIAEQNFLGITRYIRSSELIARNTDAARTYYHYVSDEMGSTTHIVDEDGIVFNHYTYNAWGNLTAQEEAVPNRFKFTGQQLDPVTQQYYLRARFYNPVIARFTQEDTYRGDGLNLYAYCANRPTYYIDPTGHWCDTKQDAFNKLAAERGLDPDKMDYDTKQRLMAEASNIVKEQKKNPYAAAQNAPLALPESIPIDTVDLPVGPYAYLEDGPNVGPGKDFTASQKRKMLMENMKRNGGVVKSDVADDCYQVLTQPQKSMKGVTPNPDEWQFDHITSKKKGGSNSFANAQITSRKYNREKWYK